MKPFLLLMTIPLLLGGCGEKIEPGLQQKEGKTITGLTLGPVQETTLAGAQGYVAAIESGDRAVVTARIDGRIATIAAREGEKVRKGDLLVTIAGNVAADRLAEARGNRDAAAARYDLAHKTHERFAKLAEAEAVTPQEMDRATAELEMAKKGLDAADAVVEAARTMASFSRLTAPFDGTVVERKVEEGTTVMPGTPLIVIDRSGGWIARATVPESEAARLAAGDAMRVEVHSLGRSFDGTVGEILPAADPSSRALQVKIHIPPAEGLVAGLFARVYPLAFEETTLLLDASAVVTRGQLEGVYVVEDGVLRYRLVKTGRDFDGRVEILSGLRPGETVVVGGVERAASGARVKE